MKRRFAGVVMILALGCTGPEPAGEETEAAGTATSTTEQVRKSNYGDRIVDAKKRAEKMAEEQNERSRELDEAITQEPEQEP